ncbi:MAG: TonB-dependent receptor [PS1 clade bacterium]|nr:TonB-dependent receptor [PS1 clade bacterium]
MTYFNVRALFIAALVSNSPNSVFAQESADGFVDELVVTTTRTEAPRLENPGNITTIDPDTRLSNYPADLLNQAPGINIHRGNGQEHLTAIRSPVLVGGAGAGSFLYLEDGISMRAPGFANVNALMDAMSEHADTIEIVRGPGSALYGSNAVHGMINLISGPISENATQLNSSVGSYGRYALNGQSSYVDDDGASRFSISLNGDEEGYRANSGFEQQKMRVETQWRNGATDYHFSLAGMNLNQETAGYVKTEDCASGQEAYEDESCAKTNPFPEAYRDAQALRSFLRMERTLEDGATFTMTPYIRTNDMEFLMHFLPGKAVEENEHTSIGAQLSYARDAGSVSYVTGIDGELTTGKLTEIQTQTATPSFQAFNYLVGTHYDYEVDATTLAPYVHAVWHLSDATDLTTGLRAEYTEYDYDNRTDDGLQGKLFRPADRTDEFFDVSPKLALVHRLNDNRRVFASLTRAARAPQTTDLYRLRDADKTGPLEPNPADVDSETLDSFEIGYRVAGQDLSYEISVFTMRKENYHFRDGSDYYETDGETTHQGIEVELDWQMSDVLSLHSGLSWASHEYAFNRDVSGGNALESISDGNDIDSAPDTLGNTVVRWQASSRVSASAQWEHVGSYYMDASNTTKYDGHDLVNLAVNMNVRDGLSLEASVLNLFDEDYAKRADVWFGDKRYFPGEPQRFMFGVKASY